MREMFIVKAAAIFLLFKSIDPQRDRLVIKYQQYFIVNEGLLNSSNLPLPT